MSKNLIALALLAAGCLMLSACGEPAANNAANKPANAANNAATAPVNTAAIETDLKKMTSDMAATLVKGDTAAIEKLYNDNYMFVGPDGAVATKAQRLESMKSGDTKLESLTFDEVSVRVNPEGTGAIVVSKATVKGKNMGKPVEGVNRVSHVWRKTPDGWRLVHGQVSPLTAATSPGKVDETKSDSTANSAVPANK
ncbi:MAG TPA: nuclear transport factor 2 family protein [Pyrinomonadaceae bacterium]|nr:nuclear transport factor 2 family protein [Pyrinomonadaceae bacterium]